MNEDSDRYVFVDPCDDLRNTLAELKELGRDLAQALLEMRCDCPNYAPCRCQRQSAIDAWVEGTR